MNDEVYMMYFDINGVYLGYGMFLLICKFKGDYFVVLYDEKMDVYYMSGIKYQIDFLN